MTLCKSILLLISLGTIAALVGCGSGPGAPTVSLSTVPTTLAVNSQTSITATTTNTTADVTWSVTCTDATSSSACGSFSSATTASGAAVTYTAPAFIATNVVITATLNSNITATANTAIGGAGLTNGSYVFSLNGLDTNGPYYVSGAFTVSNGTITGGEQDFVDFNNADNSDQINPAGSTVTTTADGNLQIVLTTCTGPCATSSGPDSNVGVGGVETINGTVLPLSSTGRTLINEFDASASGSGELDAQTSAAASVPSGGYAFTIGGWDNFENQGAVPFAIGGVINVDNGNGAGTISGTGSIFDLNVDYSETYYQGITIGASTYSGPDPSGRVTFTINPTGSNYVPSFTLIGYIVNSSQIRLVEGDGDQIGGIQGGLALSQGSNTGTFTSTSASVVGNNFVLGLTGEDTEFFLQAVGQITPSANGGVTGFVDFSDLSGSDTYNPDPVTAPAYSVASTGDITIAGVTDGNGITYNLQLYLDGNGNALVITLDPGDVLSGYGVAQTGGGSLTAASFKGPYGFSAAGLDTNYDGPFAAVGPVTADGVGTISGFVDLNWLNFTSAPEDVADAPVSGTFVTTGSAAANGIFSSGSVTGIDLTNCTLFTQGAPGCTADVFDYYLYDAAGDSFAIETDTNQLTLGVLSQQ
jgi:hypothetical protein